MCTLGQHESIADTITDELNKYLEQAEERRKSETNYFQKDNPKNISAHTLYGPYSQEVENTQPNKEVLRTPPESFEEDTGDILENNTAQIDDDLSTIPEQEEEEEDLSHQDTLTFNDKQDQTHNEHFDTAMDTTSEDFHITMGKPTPMPFVMDLVHVPTEKVGCSQLTHKLQKFLEDYPPRTQEHAFETIYHILEHLEKYLSDNPQQHMHCMSPDSEYVILVTYSFTLGIDMCNFLNIWAVLSILLYTSDK